MGVEPLLQDGRVCVRVLQLLQARSGFEPPAGAKGSAQGDTKETKVRSSREPVAPTPVIQRYLQDGHVPEVRLDFRESQNEVPRLNVERSTVVEAGAKACRGVGGPNASAPFGCCRVSQDTVCKDLNLLGRCCFRDHLGGVGLDACVVGKAAPQPVSTE
jgi:hypothetical protein